MCIRAIAQRPRQPRRRRRGKRVRELVRGGEPVIFASAIASTRSAELAIASANDFQGVVAAYDRLTKLSTTIELDFALADALERLGRVEQAAAAFARFADHPQAWYEPIASTRAWYRLGLLRERLGDPAGARAAFDEVLARWGGTTDGIPEVADARKRARR